MNKNEYDLLSPWEVTCFISGLMIGMGALILPNDVMATSRQDGWISAALGAAYPLLVMVISVYIIKNNNGTGLLDLSRKFYGKIIGSILNILFSFQFLFYCTSVADGFSNLLRMYMVSFLEPVKILIVVFVLAAYASGKGLKTIARVNEIMFFLTIIILMLTITAVQKSNVLNISPVFGSGIKNIILGTKETMFAYATSETVLLIPSLIRDKNKIKSSFIKAIAATAVIYTWMTFITIYYLGPDIIPKFLWAFISVTDSIEIPLVTNFRFIFAYLWSLIIFKTISNEYYFSAYIISDVSKINFKIVNICLFPILLFVSRMFGNETVRRRIGAKVVPWITIFSILFIFSIAAITFAKKVINNEKVGK